MSLIYDTNNKVFLKQDYQKHSGKPACYKDSTYDAFYVNKFINSDLFNSDVFEFNTPSYHTLGGTVNYYGQDYWSVFTNVSKPFIKFTFTANTNSFGTGTTIKHNIYRVPYKDYIEYTAEIIRKNIEANKDYSEQTIEESVVDNSGNTTLTTTTRKTSSSNTLETSAPKSFLETLSGYGFEGVDRYDKIKKSLTNPILTITASTTGISTDIYILFLEEYQKNIGNYSYQLFQDYGQYFITTQFEFDREQSSDLYDFCQLDDSKNIIPIDYQKSFQEITPTNQHIITGGTFSGVTVCGNFFTYFLIPNKPEWETPYINGLLSTFSPTFYWSNTNDGDNFLLQIVYSSGDSQSFSGTVYSYPIKKEESNLSSEELLNIPGGDWSIAEKKTNTIRQYSVPLIRNLDFWYRIGNVKEIKNIFGIKQSVITFSDIRSATTSPNSYQTYVAVTVDSPYISTTLPPTYPTTLDDDLSILTQYSLSGIVSGSVVTGATIQLIYPNGNYITQSTDSIGNFMFTNLSSGIYTLNTSYRGYQSDTRMINLTADTTMDIIKLKLTWGNKWDTWGNMANEIFGL